MGLEVATYINQLVPSNPLGTDDRSQGDDHLRLIKQVLQNTFPNINGEVTASDEVLNQAASPGSLCPPGIIVMWSGTVGTIPSGWKLCNGVGTISNGNPVPNLVDRFIVGSETDAGGNYNIGQTGGAATHTHTVTVAGTALTVDQIPAHSHTPIGGSLFMSAPRGGFPGGNLVDGGLNGAYGAATTANTGGSQTHTHGATTSSDSNIPPYFALAFLIKN